MEAVLSSAVLNTEIIARFWVLFNLRKFEITPPRYTYNSYGTALSKKQYPGSFFLSVSLRLFLTSLLI